MIGQSLFFASRSLTVPQEPVPQSPVWDRWTWERNTPCGLHQRRRGGGSGEGGCCYTCSQIWNSLPIPVIQGLGAHICPALISWRPCSRETPPTPHSPLPPSSDWVFFTATNTNLQQKNKQGSTHTDLGKLSIRPSNIGTKAISVDPIFESLGFVLVRFIYNLSPSILRPTNIPNRIASHILKKKFRPPLV